MPSAIWEIFSKFLIFCNGFLQSICFRMLCSKHSITFENTYLLRCSFHCVSILIYSSSNSQTSQLSRFQPGIARFHCLSQGLTVGSSFLTVIQFLSGSFSQTHSFLKKEAKATHPNANKERISSMINNNKTNIRSSLSLRWALLFIMSVETHIGYPFHWKTQSDFLKIAKKFTAKYNTSHFSK